MAVVKLLSVTIDAKEYHKIEENLEKNSRAKDILENLFKQLKNRGVDLSQVDEEALWNNDFNHVDLGMRAFDTRPSLVIRKIIK